MADFQTQIAVSTRGRGLHEITSEVPSKVQESGIQLGLCVLFCQHTSASLLIQENADPSAARDLEAWFERLAPEGHPAYTHVAEGLDDMPSHLRSAVTRSSESIPVASGQLQLGTWQGIFLFEHRSSPHRRNLIIHVQGSR